MFHLFVKLCSEKKKELLNLNGNISYPFERGHDLWIVR